MLGWRWLLLCCCTTAAGSYQLARAVLSAWKLPPVLLHMLAQRCMVCSALFNCFPRPAVAVLHSELACQAANAAASTCIRARAGAHVIMICSKAVSVCAGFFWLHWYMYGWYGAAKNAYGLLLTPAPGAGPCRQSDHSLCRSRWQ